MSKKRLGLIGTGIMGSGIATRLLRSGYKLMVYNRTKTKTEPLKKLGALVADTPMQVAKNSELVITVVKDDKALEDVVFGENGIVCGRKEKEEAEDGLVLADVSTINPSASRAIAKRLAEEDMTMLDTPVMGGPKFAEEGVLLVMVGGSKEVYEKHKDVFDTIGSKTFYLGENGNGHAMKLTMNLQIAMIALALSEGMTLARGCGLDPETFLQMLNSTYFKTGMSEKKGPKMVKDDFKTTFALRMMLKDLRAINEHAGELGIALPMASLAEQVYRAAARSGFGELDYTGILAFLQKINALR